jgi:hypothetical protein
MPEKSMVNASRSFTAETVFSLNFAFSENNPYLLIDTILQISILLYRYIITDKYVSNWQI